MPKKVILTVDDETHMLTLTAGRLKQHGYTVLTANSGVQGIQLALTHLPDLIILDVMMPGMDGPSVAEALKRNYQTKDIPVIFLTALVQKSEQTTPDESAMAGGNVFIAKPVDTLNLISTIERMIQLNNSMLRKDLM